MNEDLKAWEKERRVSIGASETAGVLGVEGAYTTRLLTYNSKVLGSKIEDNDQMFMGREIEGAIADLYAKKTGREVVDLGRYTIQRHPTAHLAATLDRMVVGPDVRGPLQLKSVGSAKAHEWGDEPPLHYAIQVQAEMACTGEKRGFLAGWVGGQSLIHYDLRADPEFQAEMLSAVERFWHEHIVPRIPPEPTAKDVKALQRLYPKDQGTTIPLDEVALSIADEVADLKARINAQEERKDELENRLRAILGQATWGVLPDGSRLQWQLESKKEHVVKASSTRVLRRLKARRVR